VRGAAPWGRPDARGIRSKSRRRIPHGAGGAGLSSIALELADGLLDRGAGADPASVVQQTVPAARAAVSPASLRGLDWFTFFLADIQTGFGPFVAIYLTQREWTQLDIGLVLTTGGLVALIGQMPGGALIDMIRSARSLAVGAVGAICASALALALFPVFPVVMAARVLHAAASCVLGPLIAALSLGLVGHAALGERLGRNARFASIGNGLAAAAMGACGYLVSNQAVFFLTAILAAPAILALAQIRASDVARPALRAGVLAEPDPVGWLGVLRDRRLIVFAGCVLLFQLANAAMLPLVASLFARQSSALASTWVGVCIVLPQLVVAVCSPWVGRTADSWGRRPLLLLCFGALAARGLTFALTTSPYVVMAVQMLDGISAAVLGVLVPLVCADIMRGTGRFNLGLGVVGSAVGIGACLSTTIAGYAVDHFGNSVAFAGLACVALCGLALVRLALAETRPAAG
jgi:MFS family permease